VGYSEDAEEHQYYHLGVSRYGLESGEELVCEPSRRIDPYLGDGEFDPRGLVGDLPCRVLQALTIAVLRKLPRTWGSGLAG